MRNECGLRDEEFEARIELGLTGQVMLKASTTTYKQETSTYIKHMCVFLPSTAQNDLPTSRDM